MATFRIRLLDNERRTLEEKFIKAIRNYEAIEIASRIAANSNCSSFEIWRGDRRICDAPAERIHSGALKVDAWRKPALAYTRKIADLGRSIDRTMAEIMRLRVAIAEERPKAAEGAARIEALQRKLQRLKEEKLHLGIRRQFDA
jgi:hypothetical protein